MRLGMAGEELLERRRRRVQVSGLTGPDRSLGRGEHGTKRALGSRLAAPEPAVDPGSDEGQDERCGDCQEGPAEPPRRSRAKPV
jgi:hypothetical protein